MPVHRYLCPLRWADMDQLGHVNNVVYVDYLQEARVDMLRAHAPVRGGEELAEGVVVVRHEVDYLRPLVFRPEPVAVEVWVSEVRAASFTLCYEIADQDADGARVVYLRARSQLAPYVFADERPRRITEVEHGVLDRLRAEPGSPVVAPRRREGRLPRDPHGARRHRYDCHVRFSDVDLYRHVNNVTYFEYVQEARIDLFGRAERPDGSEPLSTVVAAMDVDYLRPLVLRPEPYPVFTWVDRVDRVGRSSFVLASLVTDGTAGQDGEVLARARATMVAFDATSGRAAPLPAWLRAHLTAASE